MAGKCISFCANHGMKECFCTEEQNRCVRCCAPVASSDDRGNNDTLKSLTFTKDRVPTDKLPGNGGDMSVVCRPYLDVTSGKTFLLPNNSWCHQGYCKGVSDM